jgi:two-component system response regulator RegA
MTRILLIDDDAPFRLRLAQALARRGLAVAEAGGPDTGLALARGGGFDAVLVDLRMPGGSGLDLIPHLTTLQPAPRIVLLTGFGSIPTAVEAVRRGGRGGAAEARGGGGDPGGPGGQAPP